MSARRIGLLVALCSLQQILGHVPLPAPCNVTLLSKGFDMVLTWLPGEGSPPDVLYTVRYRSWNHIKKWKKVKHCKNISRTTCNLTCVPDPFLKYGTRVKALAAGRQSPWVESGSMEYHFDVQLAPPALEVNVTENTINVSAAFPVPSCVEDHFIDLKYDLDFWKAGTENKQQRYDDNRKWEKVTISSPMLSGNYCLNARASYQATHTKHSEFSKPFCMLLNPKATVDWKFPLTVAVPLFVLLFISTSAASILRLCKQAAKRETRPQALDFSHFRAPGKILVKESNEKEFFEKDHLICMGTPAPGRSDSSARSNESLMASSLSILEEEEGDCGSFSPYSEMPRVLKRAPNCQASSGSQQGSHLGSELGDSHIEGGSLPDLAGLGFSQFVWRGTVAEEDTSGFQDSEKSFLSTGSSLADLFLTEAIYPASSVHEQQDMGMDACPRQTFLQVSVLAEALTGRPPTDEPCQSTRGPHYINHQWHHDRELVCAATQVNEDFNGFLLEEQLVCFQTLKIADDEGVWRNSGSLSCCSEEDPPPLSSVLSRTFEAETQEKGGSLQQESNSKVKFQGYQHMHYMPRN